MELVIDEKKGTFVLTGKVDANPRPTASQKNLLLATSSGTIVTTAQFGGKPVKIGVNIFVGK